MPRANKSKTSRISGSMAVRGLPRPRRSATCAVAAMRAETSARRKGASDGESPWGGTRGTKGNTMRGEEGRRGGRGGAGGRRPPPGGGERGGEGHPGAFPPGRFFAPRDFFERV